MIATQPLSNRSTLRGLVLAAVTLLAGCATTFKPPNQPMATVDESAGYRRITEDRSEQIGDTMILLAFSGGGTRAAALSYGVMQELRDTYVTSDGVQTRLLDEVDTISSVSGGSFTAAYYGLYRDRIFDDYERRFLRQDVQSSLIRKLFSPGHWVNSAFSGFDRTEMAIDYYDRSIFQGGTFDDMAAQGPPYIDINATDLTSGMRFTFSQELFDMICSDLGSMKVARAVTASSAVPVAFPTVVLENHADQCDVSDTRGWALLRDANPTSEAQKELVAGLKSYRDVDSRKYIHLVDGGISDNLGLRAMIDRIENIADNRFYRLQKHGIKNVLIILVNAEVQRDSFIEQTAKKPGASTTMSAFIDSQMRRYNQETLDRMHKNIERMQNQARQENLPVRFFFSQVAFDHIQSTEVSNIFNNMPTSLELDDDDVDKLIAGSRMLLRHNPSFQQFKARNNAQLAPGAMNEQALCAYFEHPKCNSTNVD